MAFKVSLTTVSGQKTDRTEIQDEPTPKVGDEILVVYVGDTAYARVTAVRKGPILDEVEAREM